MVGSCLSAFCQSQSDHLGMANLSNKVVLFSSDVDIGYYEYISCVNFLATDYYINL